MRRFVIVSCLLLGHSVALAQPTRARRLVAAGEVTGLEMGIEGSLSALPGAPTRWFVTLYEVVRHRDLRPSADATLRVLASFSRGEPIAVVQTDAGGRATIEIPIPDDLVDGALIQVEAVSPRRVRRVFSVGLSRVERESIELYVDRAEAPPGASIGVIGRVLDDATGRPVAEREVRVRLWDRGPLGAPVVRTTDARGVFGVDGIELPESAPGSLRLVATTDGASAERGIQSAVPERPALWVEATAPALAAPGERMTVEVLVRTPDGVPIAGARVAWSDANDEERRETPRTDSEGRARLRWAAPRAIEEPWRALSRTVTAVDTSRGTVQHTVSTRVARVPVLAAWAVDGGAFVPALRGRVFLRVTTPEGVPHSGEIRLEAPRLGGTLRASTDEDGVATFEAPVAGATSPDACGGPTVLEAWLVVGEHRERLCLPVDPDASLRVVSARVTDGGVDVELERAPGARTAPIELTALRRRDDRWVPLARVFVPAGGTRATMPLPPEARGELWLRARPIVEGGGTARGGGRLIHRPWATQPIQIEASAERGVIRSGGDATLALFAAASPAMRDAVQAHLGPVGAAIDAGRGARFVDALLAARTPFDAGASRVLRASGLVPQPLPADPVALGLLRDPWRTRARFVRGRIGMLMGAVETYVESLVPARVEEVGVRERGGWRFNHSVLEAAIEQAGLGEESATSLDGEPLDAGGLSALDATFTFDHVARRITRARLWQVLVMLRQASVRLGLDRPWARRGDPSQLVVSLLDLANSYRVEFTVPPSRELLFDGWGQPFVLRPARGGRAAFRFLEPVDGWELVSVGPDGRAGTGDDISDPFARVLPSGGIYAEAVGEDVLLARLNGVSLGRATLESLAEVFETEVPEGVEEVEEQAHASWGSLPTLTAEQRRLGPVDPMMAPVGGLGAEPSWTLPSARREYDAVGVRFGADGGLRSAHARFVAGAPWVARMELPPVLRPGERLRLPLTLVQLAEAPPPRVDVSVTGRALDARIDGTSVVLQAREPGLADVRVTVRMGERELSRFQRRVRVVPDGLLRQRAHVVRVDGTAEIIVPTPELARPWRSELVVGAPRSLANDPAFLNARERTPGLFAWAQAMAGESVDEDTLARAIRSESDLETACAVVAWATTQGHVARIRDAMQRVVTTPSDDLARRASILAALSASASLTPDPSDPVSAHIAQLREDGWRAVASASDQPAVMARMAAALLLADRDDGRGHALFARARDALRADDNGRRWVPGSPLRAGDSWIGTLALAVAARQIGQDVLGDELADVALTRLYLADRTGVEGAFWAMAASVFGAFGVDGPESVAVEVNGESVDLALHAGVGSMVLPPDARVRVTSSAPVWARVESRYLVPIANVDAGPLRARVEGSAGRAGGAAGFELVVTNQGEELVGVPIVEVVLPGAASLPAEVVATLVRSPDVVRVSPPDGAGVVRIHLAPMAVGSEHRVPLAWRWIASGHTRGLTLVAYDASRPFDMHVRVGRTLDIEEAR